MKFPIRTTDTTRSRAQRGARRLVGTVTCGAAFVALASLASANKNSTYTSTSVCNNNNTGWTVTNTCTSTTSVGVNPPHAIQSGTQYVSPIPGLVPTASIHDQYGNPILVNGTVLTLVPSPAVTAKVTQERGLLSTSHQWAGFESNVTLDPPDNVVTTMSTVYVVTFSWSAPVGPTGAVWCSNNGDDLWGDIVYDGFNLIPGSAGSPYCFGDGSGTACPCGNAGAAFNGCANSINPVGAHLGAAGLPSIAADTLVLTGSGMASGSAGLYFQGTAQAAGGAGSAFGDGLFCVGGTIVRIGVKFSPDGWSQYPAPGDPSLSVVGGLVAGSVRNYQLWYRDSNAYCTPSTFNFTNAHQVTWGP